jgi:dienelactone hydrolase
MSSEVLCYNLSGSLAVLTGNFPGSIEMSSLPGVDSEHVALAAGAKEPWSPRLEPLRIFLNRASSRAVNFTACAGLLPVLFLSGCVDHYVLHPRAAPAGARSWSEVAMEGDLRMRLEWVRPAGSRPLPAVIVHPEAGYKAADMRGVLHDLARRGYLAVAADYQRRAGDRWRESLFPWQDPSDPRRVIERVRAHPEADPRRIGLLGFSQGGVFSLLIAAYDGGPAAVVAYYPVTDFETWLEAAGSGLGRRLVFGLIRIGFRRASGARSDLELRMLLRRASPLRQADSIKAPVLLVHGSRDGSAGVEESRRLANRLAELGRPVELLVIAGAGHVFNFRDRRQASVAWDATLAFLARHLRGKAAVPPTR